MTQVKAKLTGSTEASTWTYNCERAWLVVCGALGGAAIGMKSGGILGMIGGLVIGAAAGGAIDQHMQDSAEIPPVV